MHEPVLAPGWPADRAARPLGHAQCLDLAARSAPNAAAFQARILAARASLRRARTLPNPVVGIAWEDFAIGGSPAGPVQFTASLAYALEALVASKRKVAAANHDLEAEQAGVEADMARLAVDVWRAYDGLVEARSRVSLAHELVGLSARNRDDVARFVATGEAPRIDLARAEAEHAAARADAAAVEADARVRELELAFALGFEHPVALTLSEPMTDAGPAPGDLDEALVAAVHARPEFRAAEARYAAALERLRIHAARPHLLPAPGIGYRTTGGADAGVASLDVVLPLFDTGGADLDEGDAGLLAAAAELRRTARAIAEQVTVSAERLRGAQAFLEVHARCGARRRRELREGAERLFRAGEGSFEELVLAQRDEVVARGALLDAEAAAAAARVAFDAASGTLAKGPAR